MRGHTCRRVLGGLFWSLREQLFRVRPALLGWTTVADLRPFLCLVARSQERRRRAGDERGRVVLTCSCDRELIRFREPPRALQQAGTEGLCKVRVETNP